MNPSIESKSMMSSIWMNANERMSVAASDAPPPDRFAALLKKTGANPPTAQPDEVVIKSGDTLVGIVQRLAAQRGDSVTQSQAFAQAMTLAKANGIDNPNRIFPGQRLSLSSLTPQAPAQAHVSTNAMSVASNAAAVVLPTPSSVVAPMTTSAALAVTSPEAVAQPGQAPVAAAQMQDTLSNNTQAMLSQRQAVAATSPRTMIRNGDLPNTPILTRTLDRAVAKGFIPAGERQAVYDKIMDMSKTYGFVPDDFARMTLMESDGMNPKATNTNCHGIIQFCDGPDRGAASAGFASNPKAILNRSVLQQLDLVSKYFDDTGLRKFSNVGQDDLYLTVLTPAARNEGRANARLNIPGLQAEHLYTNNDRRLPITRQSIVQGLHQNAQERLGMDAATYSQLVNRAGQLVQRASTQISKASTQVVGQGVWLASANGNPAASGKNSPPPLPGGQGLPRP